MLCPSSRTTLPRWPHNWSRSTGTSVGAKMGEGLRKVQRKSEDIANRLWLSKYVIVRKQDGGTYHFQRPEGPNWCVPSAARDATRS